MKDNELIDLLATTLDEGLANAGLQMPVVQLFQPTQQGVEEDAVYFQKLFDERYGWTANSKQTRYKFDYKTDPENQTPDSPEVDKPNTVDPMNQGGLMNDATYLADVDQQQIITTFQISIFLQQHPGEVEKPTASDVMNYLAQYISHRQIMMKLRKYNVGVLRIKMINNNKIHTDLSQFQAMPAFQIELTHVREFSLAVDEINTFSGNVYVVNDEVKP